MEKEDEDGHEGDLRVWHIPQVPGPAFRQRVESLTEARVVLMALATYDEFQFKNKIKPDYANAQGLEVFEDGEWVEWSDEAGNSIDTSSEE